MEDEHQEILFHEDDYCQIELVPKENFFALNNELEVIQDNTSVGNNGFLSIVSRNQIKRSLKERNIRVSEFDVILSKDSMFRYGKVYKGYSEHKEFVPHTKGYGFENYVLFVSDANGIVSRSWIIYKRISDTLNITPQHLKKALFDLGQNFHLFLVDWNELITINLEKKGDVENYIENVL
jgi:hypothetical protein